MVEMVQEEVIIPTLEVQEILQVQLQHKEMMEAMVLPQVAVAVDILPLVQMGQVIMVVLVVQELQTIL